MCSAVREDMDLLKSIPQSYGVFPELPSSVMTRARSLLSAHMTASPLACLDSGECPSSQKLKETLRQDRGGRGGAKDHVLDF